MLTTKTWMLLIAAALLLAIGLLNLSQRASHKLPPEDGITWVQDNKGILAKAVEPNSPGARAGIISGDYLISIRPDEDATDEKVKVASEVQIYLEEAGVGGRLTYLIERPSYPETIRFYFADVQNLQQKQRWHMPTLYLNLVGIVYLFVGFFVLFKQGGRTPFVLHFAVTFLAAFVFHFYTPSGKFDRSDMLISWLDEVAFIFFAPLFLHFCLIYPVRYHLSNGKYWRAALLYVPAIILLFITSLNYLPPSKLPVPESVNLDEITFKANFIHFTVALLIGACFLIWRFVKNEQAVYRQQLKWLVWGSALALIPFTSLYGVRYIFDLPADRWTTALAIGPLVLIPLTFGNSVMRYRLMDVDIVARRAMVYAFTTLAIAMLIGAVVLSVALYALGDTFALTEVASGNLVLFLVTVIAMAGVVMAAGPIRHFLQERADRFFYGETYDMRRSLLDFGRTLSATTALDPLLNALVSRLQQVLNVERVAIFIEDENHPSNYKVARAVGFSQEIIVPNDFREMIRTRSAETGVVRADDLDISESQEIIRRPMHYYVPCVVRGKMVAVIGLGRAANGALLSSEDVEILRTISGYVAVAIENSLLYQEQQQRAAELESLKDFNESIVESVNVGLLAVDLEGKVSRCNSTLERILEIKGEDAIGKHVDELFSEDFAETLDQILGEAKWGLTELRTVYKLHTATRVGRSLVLNVSLAPLQATSAERTGAIIVIEDVTMRTRLEEQLQQREKLSSIGLLASGVAHEVNTPLTGVSSYTQMLLSMIPETDPKHALLQKVHKQTDRASNIVNNLLNFSRVGNMSEFSDIDIHRVLDDTIQLLEPQMRRSQIEIVRNYDEELPKIIGNAGKLQQVFTNLLLNSRDAIPESGVIELTTILNDDESITIKVADNGIGISPENMSKIYDPFFTTKGVGLGTGLGLAVTYGIVQEHSGHISVESAPGHGTTFRVTLPMADIQSQRLQAAGD